MYEVYEIKNPDGFVYIGQTKDLKARVLDHIRTKPEFRDCELSVTVLRECSTKAEALEVEKEYITDDFLNDPKTLNKRAGGGGVTNGFKGVKRPDHSELMKRSNGAAHLNNAETHEKMRLSRRSDESRAKSRMHAKGNTNVRGRRWYNDGQNNFMLIPSDPKVSGLEHGRVK